MKLYSPHFTLSLIAAATLTLTACGGGGGGTAATGNATAPAGTTAALLTPVTTTVMDGLITNAQVCVDSNNNGTCEASETQGRTNAAGQVTLNIPTANLATAKLVAQIGLDATDADTGAVKTAYTMQTPAGKHSVISPLTTLVQTKIDTDKAAGLNTTVEAAETHIKSQIGLTALTVSVFDDYVAKRDSSDEHKKAGVFAATYVLSVQKSKERDAQDIAAGTASTCTTTSTKLASANYATHLSSEKNEGSDDHSSNELDEHTKENHIDSNLLNNLEAVRHAAESDHDNKSSDDIKNLVPYVSTCAPTTTAPTTNSGSGSTGTATPTTPATTPTAQATAGKTSYMSLCAACHTATPTSNVSKILKGANSSSSILKAISSDKGGMGFLSGSVNATVSADIAAYLATPGI